MKVLSLTQPWATLMAIDAKRFETRSWSTPHRGPLAIAASAGYPRDCRRLVHQRPFIDALRGAGESDLYGAVLLPLGKIIAVVDVVDCVPTEDCFDLGDSLDDVADGGESGFDRGELIAAAILDHAPMLAQVAGVAPAPHERDFGDYSRGRCAWVTRNVRRLVTPIPAKGKLGLWTFPDEAIERALRGETSP
jgi:hypothetical protein